MPLTSFDTLIREWFAGVGEPTEPQRLGWPEILSGRDVLISAPTGSGKTLAAFLSCLDNLVRLARTENFPDETTVLYVSPLKALSNDIRKNLDRPLEQIRELADRNRVPLKAIRTALRTGDTKTYDRLRMTQKPPHILVTTPESLFILLTAEKSRRILNTVRTVIIDEIHAVADDKRGSHLAISLARLEKLVVSTGNGPRPQRIGLSATVNPLDEVARFLSPEFTNGRGRLVAVGHQRKMDLAVEVPGDELTAVAPTETWAEIYDRLAELIRTHRTTLVFVNTRRLSERVAHQLQERLGAEAVLPHHGSLSRQLRLNAEQRLKEGQLGAVVATASLELGIDIGTVDLACQIGSPRSIAVALQRVGRSGHWVGALPKGRFFPTTRDELVECAALVRAMRKGELDRLEIPQAPLDILAQQIVAEVACNECSETEMFDLVRSTYPYRNLEWKEFDEVIDVLAEGIATSRGRSGAYLHRDRVNRRLRARRGARLAAITSGGAIPDNAQYAVIAEPEGSKVGMIDEDFAIESAVGDVFLLGTTSWRIRRIESGRVRVEDAGGASPTIPFWMGEAPGRTVELSNEVSVLREDVVTLVEQSRASSERTNDFAAAQRFLADECALDCRGAEQLIEYVLAGRNALGALPTQNRVVAERFFDEAGGMQLVIHAPFGARINRAWGLSLRKKFCRSFNLELQAAATDNGLLISLTEQHAFPLELVFEFVRRATLDQTLTQALLDSPMFASRWRWNVSRALAVPRFSGGRKTPPPIQRMRSDDLLAAVFPDQAACAENLTGEIRIPDHPYVRETIDNCLNEAMNLVGLRRIVERIESGALETVATETAEPSPFSHEILNSNPYSYLDDAPLEERRARAVQMRRTLAPEMLDGPAALDAEAIAIVAEQAWPIVRDADELHDALLSLITLPPVPEWDEYHEELCSDRRATTLWADDKPLWVAAERLATARLLHADAAIEPVIKALQSSRNESRTREAAAADVLRGWLDAIVPATASELAERLSLPPALVEAGLIRLESEGRVLRGNFSPGSSEAGDTRETEWANRHLLARIHRLTLGRLRREIEPVTTADFVRFLLRWQHVMLASRLHGVDGVLQVIKQLQGYEISAAAWESEILPRRIVNYQPALLDRLCLAGEVTWGRLSPHPAFSGNADESENRTRSRRVRPTRAAPLTIFLREDAGWLLTGGLHSDPDAVDALSHPAREVWEALRKRGSSFFADLCRATGRLSSEVEDGLWELAAAGLVTADGFENLRSLIDPKRRRGEGRGRKARPRHAAGRWALLEEAVQAAADSGDRDPAEQFARQLLRRWGVVFRDIVRRESLAPPWRDLLVVLRRMEARGEIRGGRFAAAFVGEQFALPEAVALLRNVRRTEPKDEEAVLGSSDPLNLVGVLVSGPRVNANTAETIRIRNGVPAEQPATQTFRIEGAPAVR
ncbi:MAG: DEAD/DEAH box helicase [Bryobacterales bacterium]|nr:DEAD/DEAH box helicase [Bryobacterales bacterium]